MIPTSKGTSHFLFLLTCPETRDGRHLNSELSSSLSFLMMTSAATTDDHGSRCLAEKSARAWFRRKEPPRTHTAHTAHTLGFSCIAIRAQQQLIECDSVTSKYRTRQLHPPLDWPVGYQARPLTHASS
jgi:hypothetical protein